MMTALEFFRLRVQAVALTKLSQTDMNTIEFYLNKAKEMEEKQIKDAWLSAWKDSMLNPLSDECYQELADEYYKQKYEE